MTGRRAVLRREKRVQRASCSSGRFVKYIRRKASMSIVHNEVCIDMLSRYFVDTAAAKVVRRRSATL